MQTAYDDEGSPVKVTRRGDPDPGNVETIVDSAVFDAAGRKIVAIAPDMARDSMVYDAAGNVLEHHTRRHDPTVASRRLVLMMTYDVLNRLRTRRTPAVDYRRDSIGLPLHFSSLNGNTSNLNTGGNMPAYPRYSNNSASLGISVPADEAVFDYDSLGRMIVADNRDAQVRRSYYRNGQLRGDTLYTRTVPEGGSFTAHRYGLENFYDLDGRRTQLKHPDQLAATAGSDRTSFGFDPVTGGLRSVVDLQGNEFRYHYSLRGDLDSLYMPSNAVEGYGYDADGNLSRHVTKVGIDEPRDATLTYDARGKLTKIANRHAYVDTTSFAFSGLGHIVLDSIVAWSREQGTGDPKRQITIETFEHDALDNLRRTYTQRRTSKDPCPLFRLCNEDYVNGRLSDRAQLYTTGTGRFEQSRTNGDAGLQYDTTSYDEAGNTVFTTPLTSAWAEGPRYEDRMSYYAADGKLYAADYRWVHNIGNQFFGTTFEEYRYDALGRRIWLRSRRFCYQDDNTECTLSFIRRTVWDGDAELYEIQMPGWTQTASDTLEHDVEASRLALVSNNVTTKGERNKYFGRVAYTYGLHLDRPLSVTRFRYADATNRYGQTALDWYEYPTFTLVPLWNERGRADNGYFVPGQNQYCPDSEHADRCVTIDFPAAYNVLAYNNWNTTPQSFHGSLLDDKRDMTGTWYRRNRSYDPGTGRFTQEDPIGLAGGINLYGFAAGDPVTYSDPFGLCPGVLQGGLASLKCGIQEIMGGVRAAPGQLAGLFNVAATNPIASAAVFGIAGPGSSGGRVLFQGSRSAFRAAMRTEWVEGISGGQGLQILARLGKSRVDDLAVTAGEGGNVIGAFTRLLDEGAEVTLRTYNKVGKEISTIRRELNKAGEVIREGVIR